MSVHFAPHEFACPHCGATFVRPHLLQVLEAVRMMIGKPIRIVSGYRCPVHNLAIKGARDSQHVYAAAADLPLGLVTLDQAQHAGARGVGLKRGFVTHLDVRDGPFTLWHYPD